MKRCLAIAVVLIALPIHAIAQPSEVDAALVVVVASPPLFSSDGTLADDADARTARLAKKLSDLRALADRPPYALAISPLLCDEAKLAGTEAAKRFLSELRAAASVSTVLVTPYADARLAGLEAREIAGQLTKGRAAIEECVQRKTVEIAYPPDLRVDASVAEALSAIGIRHSFSDRDVAFTNTDTTFIPGRSASEGGDPGAAIVVDLAREEVATITGLSADEQRRFGSIDELAESTVADPAFLEDDTRPAHLNELARAQEALERFDSFAPDGTRLLEIWKTSVARVASSAEWDGRREIAAARARALIAVTAREQDHVTIHIEPVTFTARQGALPVTIENTADYPVEISILVASQKLDFSKDSWVGTIDPPGDTVTFEATARSTGTFPTDVVVTSPDNDIRFDTAELTVRSTAANLSAVLLTAGGALFLIVWFAGRIRRRAVAHRS